MKNLNGAQIVLQCQQDQELHLMKIIYAMPVYEKAKKKI